MFSSRKEGFRYEFGTPLSCTFEVISINDTPLESNWGEAHLINISPHGLKLSSQLDIPITDKKIGVKVSFMILNEPITVSGSLVWQKKEYRFFTYGVLLEIDQVMERNIIEELKRYTKQLRKEQLVKKEG